MKSKQTTFIITLVIIALSLILLLKMRYTQYKEQHVLRATNIEMEGNKDQLSKLDTISLGLQGAENKRIFCEVQPADPAYFYLTGEFFQCRAKGVTSDISNDLAKKNRQVLL